MDTLSHRHPPPSFLTYPSSLSLSSKPPSPSPHNHLHNVHSRLCSLSFSYQRARLALFMDRYMMQAKNGIKIVPKTILLVRHGQSIHNAQVFRDVGADENDGRYMDAALTSKGEQQACDIYADVQSFNAQLIVSSPFTRAIQTAKLATAKLATSSQTTFIINPLCGEKLAYSCDIGSPISTLSLRFPDLDFSHIENPNAWWWTTNETHSSIIKGQKRSLQLLRQQPPGFDNEFGEPDSAFYKRVQDFRMWLLNRPETRIVIFAHGIFLYALNGEMGPYFHNCETRRLVL